jgi:hypothetical protein
MHSKMDTRSRSVRPMSDVRLIALYLSCRALWSLRLRMLQEGLRALAARRRACDGAPDRRANLPAVLVNLCASEGPARPSQEFSRPPCLGNDCLGIA